MEKITGNEPATPYTYKENSALGEIETTYSGLTIRQHFAAMAMQGLLPYYYKSGLPEHEYAAVAVRLADNLIDELNK